MEACLAPARLELPPVRETAPSLLFLSFHLKPRDFFDTPTACIRPSHRPISPVPERITVVLQKLVPADPQVPVQDTTFSTDALGRYICSTWQEATGNGGPPFSAVVVGAGMYGAYCATKLYRQHPSKRVLRAGRRPVPGLRARAEPGPDRP